jgi:acetyltransferase-like isoleucine patch superfamily enzyme
VALRGRVVSKEPDAAAAAAKRGRLRYYLDAQSTGLGRYVLEQTLYLFLSGLPGLLGVGLRSIAYRLILQSSGLPVIEDHVRLAQPANIHLGRNVYVDSYCYLHACPEGIFVGDETFLMHGCVLHVHNFRDLPNAGIWIGRNCYLGEGCLIRGQGECISVTRCSSRLACSCSQWIIFLHILIGPSSDRGSRPRGSLSRKGRGWVRVPHCWMECRLVGAPSLVRERL